MSLKSVPTGKPEPLTRQVYSHLIRLWEQALGASTGFDEVYVPTRAELAKGKLPYMVSDSGYLPSPGRSVHVGGATEGGSLTLGQVLDDVNAKGNKSGLGRQFMAMVRPFYKPNRWDTTHATPPRPPVVARTGITTAFPWWPDGWVVPDPPPGDPVWQKYHGTSSPGFTDEIVRQAKGADPKPGRIAGQLEFIKGGRKGSPPASWAPGWGQPIPYEPPPVDPFGFGTSTADKLRKAEMFSQWENMVKGPKTQLASQLTKFVSKWGKPALKLIAKLPK